MADFVVDDDDDNSRIVTEFLLNTCGLLQPTIHHVRAKPHTLAATLCGAFATVVLHRSRVKDDVHAIPLTTGSSAEFYIQPMLLCVGDVDIMYRYSDELAIPGGYPPPTELPPEFHSRVEVYEIIDSEYPGYVYLMWSYSLTEDSDTGKYNAVRYDDRSYMRLLPLHLMGLNLMDCEHHGPAITIGVSKTASLLYGKLGQNNMLLDAVHCTRCLMWPPQAADWPTRHRNHEWPDSATVDRVVSNGCDVVHVAHRQCRQDECMSRRQWRLSFSRAEIVLLNSWMPVQQIIYHMLRLFIKTERLTDIKDSSGTKILSNYHIKTLTLWACEVKPQRWWTDDMNVVRICVKLFHIFADWLKNKICPHYFLNNCNLFYDTERWEIIASQLVSITESWLSTWFLNNYLHKCAHLCPGRVSRLFDDVSTSMKLQNAVSAVVGWRRNTALRDLYGACFIAEHRVSHSIFKLPLTVRSCGVWIYELVKINSCLRDYFTAVSFLHVAHRVAKHSLSDEHLDVLATILGQFVGKRRYCHQLSIELSLSQAVILMKVVANSSRSTVQQIEFGLSKAYLHRALRCKNSDNDSIYCLAHVHLAVLYYTSGQYQTAIDHCTLVMRSQDHSQCSSHVVQGDLLPKGDDHIDIVLGLAVFYQYIRTAALNQQQTQYVVAFSTELFAHYLYIRCLSVVKCCQFTQMSSTDEVQRHTKYIIDIDQLFIADVLLIKLVKLLQENQCQYKPPSEHRQYSSIVTSTELDTSELAELLRQSAVQHLTTYRQRQAQRFGSIVTTVTTDFEALCAYKRGDYQRCLQLSTQNVCTLLYAVHARRSYRSGVYSVAG